MKAWKTTVFAFFVCGALVQTTKAAPPNGFFEFSGRWTGPVQFQITGSGGVDQQAHAVIPIAFLVEQEGRIGGSSPENGCRLLGLGSRDTAYTATQYNLDVTLSGCRHENLNGRYSGRFVARVDQQRLSLYMTKQVVNVFNPGANYTAEIKGQLHRF